MADSLWEQAARLLEDESPLFGNVSALLANHSTANSTWLTQEEAEHLLGDPDLDHAVALILGAIALVYGRRLPYLLAITASASLGLWTALVVHDRQAFNTPLFATVAVPEGDWVPILAGVLAGAAAAVLCKVAWKAALVLLTASLLMLLSLAVCRLFNVSPDRVLRVGASLLSAYRVVGAVVLVVSIVISSVAVKTLHKKMITFASAHLGTLLFLSGISHFASRVGAEAPFSLLDDLARIIAEVRDGRCHLWENDVAVAGLKQCDCQERCQSEICAWIASSIAVLAVRQLRHWLEERREARAVKRGADEERAPLSEDRFDGGASAAAADAAEPGRSNSKGSARKQYQSVAAASPAASSPAASSPASALRESASALRESPRSPSESPEPSPEVVGAAAPVN